MGRPEGTKNPGYAQKRKDLARAAVDRLIAEGPAPSLRELAAAADVSVPTLRHYFGDREGVVVAAFEEMLTMGSPHYRAAAEPTPGDPRASIHWLLAFTVTGWREFGVGRFFTAGISLGLGHTRFGPAFLDTLLEPLLQATEARLSKHVEWDELVIEDVRAAALQLVSPVVLALLHQDALGGNTCRALDVEGFVELHADSFVGCYAPR